MFLARVVLYSTLGWILDYLGHGWRTTEFWCLVGLFWASEQIARVETLARVEQQLTDLRRRLEQYTTGANNNEHNRP